jgi:hypothetical protein
VIGAVFRIALTTENIKSTPFGSPTGYHVRLGLVDRKINKFTDISKSSLELLQKFIDCKYISEQNKNLLKFYYYSLIN